MQNFAGTDVSDWHKTDTADSGFVPDIVLTNENAANRTGFSGAKDNKKRDISCTNTTPKRARNAMSKWAKCAHKRVARAVGYALTLGRFDSWHDLSKVLESRLEPSEIGGIAYAAMRALGADLSAEVYDAAYGGKGMPLPSLFNHLNEATFWADHATSVEIEAYCLTAFNALPPKRQTNFLDYVQGRPAA